MTSDLAVNVCMKAIQTIFMCAGPMLIAGLIVGLIVSILQAATQVNEQTLTFIPKIVSVFLTLLLFGPWIINTLTNFSLGIFETLATF
ncbi:flagellar biosynthesis protein FliQ [Desulfopila inferna]|uniref:flagellar biosynthesis protein FliQ n=1 Tax=Desulfopila inferna TaxID=468528 RepID=UPI0019629AF0|nr:flagellar biosynthesis protein FliQ [Desulfopila inferna]MBM9602985.1 flagellar biosynthesis protein FliQ [Desulfopila inferna]